MESALELGDLLARERRARLLPLRRCPVLVRVADAARDKRRGAQGGGGRSGRCSCGCRVVLLVVQTVCRVLQVEVVWIVALVLMQLLLVLLLLVIVMLVLLARLGGGCGVERVQTCR